MMRALFTSRNLVGDGLCISAALRKWHELNPEYEIDLLTDDNAELYRGMGVPLRVIFEPTEHEVHDGKEISYKIDYAFYHTFDVSKAFAICDKEKCHMAEGYARDLGVDIRTGVNEQGEKVLRAEDIGPFYDPPIVEEDEELVASVPEGVILLAPFSRSCSSHDGKPPNKCLPWHKWRPILSYLRKLGHPIRVTGSATDRADKLEVSEDEYLLGFPLRPLARVLRDKTKLLVSVDNGISHLAGSQKTPHVLLYPMCLGMHYAVPWSNPLVMPIHMDPAMAETAQLTFCVQQAYQQIQRIQKGEVILDA